ncbi:hypothetical protein D3C73_1059310 [compost metagenome]
MTPTRWLRASGPSSPPSPQAAALPSRTIRLHLMPPHKMSRKRWNGLRPARCRCSLKGKPERAKTVPHATSTRARRFHPAPSSRSIAPRWPPTWSRACCSAMRRAPSAAPARRGMVCFPKRRAAPCIWMKWPSYRPERKPRCCACWKMESIGPWVSLPAARRIAGYLPAPARTWKRR